MAVHRLNEFEKVSQGKMHGNIVTDFWYLFRFSRKYWLMPIVVLLLILGGLMVLSSTAIAPLIYTIF